MLFYALVLRSHRIWFPLQRPPHVQFEFEDVRDMGAGDEGALVSDEESLRSLSTEVRVVVSGDGERRGNPLRLVGGTCCCCCCCDLVMG